MVETRIFIDEVIRHPFAEKANSSVSKGALQGASLGNRILPASKNPSCRDIRATLSPCGSLPDHIEAVFLLQHLNQAHTTARVLDHYEIYIPSPASVLMRSRIWIRSNGRVPRAGHRCPCHRSRRWRARYNRCGSRSCLRGRKQSNPPKPPLRGCKIITAQPRGFDDVTLGRRWILLVLGGPQPAANFTFFRFVLLRGVPLRLQ